MATEEQIEKRIRYVARRLKADGISIREGIQIVRWVVTTLAEAGFPSQAAIDAENDQVDQQERLDMIARLRAEADRLEQL